MRGTRGALISTMSLRTADLPCQGDCARRVSDLRAQIAANNCGLRELGRLVDKYSLETIQAYMGHIRDNAAEAMREALGRFLDGRPRFESGFEDYLVAHKPPCG